MRREGTEKFILIPCFIIANRIFKLYLVDTIDSVDND